jgi:hypothetical protein
MAPKRREVVAYGVMYRWFADVFGLDLAEQARRLMHPDPPNKEEELAEHVKMWRDKMRKLEAHREEFKLAPIFEINAFRMLMTGNAEEYFERWEADRDTTDAAKSYGELLGKVEDYPRTRKVDSSAKEKMQLGGNPWTLELLAVGVGRRTLVEDTIMTECVRSASRRRDGIRQTQGRLLQLRFVRPPREGMPVPAERHKQGQRRFPLELWTKGSSRKVVPHGHSSSRKGQRRIQNKR